MLRGSRIRPLSQLNYSFVPSELFVYLYVPLYQDLTVFLSFPSEAVHLVQILLQHCSLITLLLYILLSANVTLCLDIYCPCFSVYNYLSLWSRQSNSSINCRGSLRARLTSSLYLCFVAVINLLKMFSSVGLIAGQ
jgi:hypothetical protein